MVIQQARGMLEGLWLQGPGLAAVTMQAGRLHVPCRGAATAAQLAAAGTVTVAIRATKQLLEAARRHVVAEMQARLRALKEEEEEVRSHNIACPAVISTGMATGLC